MGLNIEKGWTAEQNAGSYLGFLRNMGEQAKARKAIILAFAAICLAVGAASVV